MGREKKPDAQAGQLVDGEGDVVLDAGTGARDEAPGDEGDSRPFTGGGWDEEGEERRAIDRMFDLPGQLDLDPRSLVSDVRDQVLEIIKARPKPWAGTPQGEQRDCAAAVEHVATELVRRVVELVAARGTD